MKISSFRSLFVGSIIFFIAALFFSPFFVSAHEVYVLSPEEISTNLEKPALDFTEILTLQKGQFVLWAFISILLVVFVFFISISRKLERILDPIIFQLKPFAPYISQLTLGIALFASWYYGAFFGPELPVSDTVFSLAPLMYAGLLISSLLVLTGVFVRIGAALALLLFGILVFQYDIYMLNYLVYAGEMCVLLLFGASFSFIGGRRKHKSEKWKKFDAKWQKYKFLILRITFGVSLIFASVYAKFLHGSLALHTVAQYNLTDYFQFDPMFLVLGALIVEILLGLFFMLGFEIRFTALFYLGFLILSLLFFNEPLWPHYVLIGTSLAMLTHGYDKYTIEGHFFKKDTYEPIF